MNPSLTPEARSLPVMPAPDVEVSEGSSAWHRLVPLWRHAVWALAVFGLIGLSLSIRLDVQRLNQDLDRNARLLKEAQVHHERLTLELDVRQRSRALAHAASELGFDRDVPLISVGAP